MIKANELRVGNILMVDNNYWHVESILTDKGSDLELYFIENPEYDHSANADVVLLTPEILLKCGFQQDEENNNVYWIDGGTDINIECLLLNGSFIFGIVPEVWRGVSGTGPSIDANITALHQVQNLYFSIMGKELEVHL